MQIGVSDGADQALTVVACRAHCDVISTLDCFLVLVLVRRWTNESLGSHTPPQCNVDG